MSNEFYSNGKLLLSAEYAILDGAVGLAIPTKYGQSLQVTQNSSSILEWVSLNEAGNTWFSASFDTKNLSIINTSDIGVSQTLRILLLEARKQNPQFLLNSLGHEVTTKLTFPQSWGLGSSSTLINNIAQWAQVDAHQLLKNAFGGSGYDIACAQHDHPILYQLVHGLPKVEPVVFNPSFKNSIYFVHLNQKQSSKEAIATYRNKQFNPEKLIEALSNITMKMLEAKNLEDFELQINLHEWTLSEVLKTRTVKSELFPDYQGCIKSLGAWGGDFVMATGNHGTPNYFKKKGYSTLFSFEDMILNPINK